MDTRDLRTLGLTADDLQLLEEFRFDLETFGRLRDELIAGAFTPERNTTPHTVAPARPADLLAWDADPTTAGAWEAAGRRALADGQVAICVLNGGMATRFGGVVKGVVEVLGERSFLDLKLADAARHSHVPAFMMCSFATLADTRAHLERRRDPAGRPAAVHLCSQGISLRLTPAGALARRADGRPDFYAPGHGDVFSVLAASPAFAAFRAGGGRVVLISNVDNLGATLDPRVIGAHLSAGRPVTVEVAERERGDQGGAPMLVGGRLEILEGFRFPAGYDMDTVPVFNTNTLLLDATAVRADYPLTWFRADKTVDGRPVVQFERLMGEVTAFVDATFLVVPRRGPAARFMPVKTPADLERLRPQIASRLGLAV